MAKHRYKHFMHCGDCFDKGIKKAIKMEKERLMHPEPPLIIVGPNEYKVMEKNGWVEDGKLTSKFIET